MKHPDSDTLIVHPDGHTSADLIPGERDASTLTHREPGAIGGAPYGADIPPASPDWQDDATRRQHAIEGGGSSKTIRRDRDARRNA